MPRPNIVFIVTDDQGYGELGCHGNPIIQTPNLDRLHAHSTRLTDYHVGPTCAPTRAGLMTGHYHNSTGVWHTIGGRSLLRQDEWSLADALGGAGYRTGLFGKWHLGDNYPYRPQDRGFDEVATHGGGGIGNTPDYWGNNYNDDHYAVDGEWTPFEGYCTDVWFDRGLRFIERHRDRPFLCLITTNAPHGPFIVDNRFSDPYAGRVESQERAKFYGMIACIDENVGLLRQHLEEWGLTENTILIFMTDNGTACGATPGGGQFIEHGYNAGMRGIKGSEYEGGHRVPFFVHWPAGGLDRGRDILRLTANVDIMPTLLDLCGVDPGDHTFDGRSLAPLLRDADAAWADRVLVTDSQRIAHPEKWRKSAVMSQGWRLVNGRQLYDVEADPGQVRDLADQHPDRVVRMRRAYEEWWTKVSRQFDRAVPVPIGTEAEAETVLNSHDWRNDPVECAWNQAQVHAGLQCNGYWEIDVAIAGSYRFELRRWPRQEDRALGGGMPGEIKSYNDIEDGYGGGRALSISRARLEVGDHRLETAVGPNDKAVVFTCELTAGQTRLQTWFTGPAVDLGAYYVYVERL